MSSNSQKILKQLQQNQALRIQNFRLKALLRDNSKTVFNTIRHNQMIIQKINTDIKLSLKLEKDHRCKYEVCLEKISEDLSNLILFLVNFNNNFNCSQQKNKDYQKQTFSQHNYEYIKNKYEMQNKKLLNQIIYLKQTNKKYSQQNQMLNNSQKKADGQIKRILDQLSVLQQSVNKLKHQNNQLSKNLRQSRQMAQKHVQYLKKSKHQTQIQNQKLILIQKEQSSKQQQLNKKIQTLQLTKGHYLGQIQNLKLQIKVFQQKFKDLLEKQNIIKHLQTNRTQKQPLTPIKISQNNQTYRSNKKQIGKMVRKFNLQSFNQQLNNASTGLH